MMQVYNKPFDSDFVRYMYTNYNIMHRFWIMWLQINANSPYISLAILAISTLNVDAFTTGSSSWSGCAWLDIYMLVGWLFWGLTSI